jgi:hypothetical protein
VMELTGCSPWVESSHQTAINNIKKMASDFFMVSP